MRDDHRYRSWLDDTRRYRPAIVDAGFDRSWTFAGLDREAFGVGAA
jgi:hypothetical protein